MIQNVKPCKRTGDREDLLPLEPTVKDEVPPVLRGFEYETAAHDRIIGMYHTYQSYRLVCSNLVQIKDQVPFG